MPWAMNCFFSGSQKEISQIRSFLPHFARSAFLSLLYYPKYLFADYIIKHLIVFHDFSIPVLQLFLPQEVQMRKHVEISCAERDIVVIFKIFIHPLYVFGRKNISYVFDCFPLYYYEVGDKYWKTKLKRILQIKYYSKLSFLFFWSRL